MAHMTENQGPRADGNYELGLWSSLVASETMALDGRLIPALTAIALAGLSPTS